MRFLIEEYKMRVRHLTTLFTPAVLLLGLAWLASPAFAAPAAKVQICHIPPDDPDNLHTITISENALSAHLAHGDYGGECKDCQTLCDTDGNACTIAECDSNGDCVPEDPVDCNDSDLCTTDSCDPGSGCVNTPTVCNADNLCTVSICAPDSGECVDSPVVCDDSGDECNPANGQCELAAVCPCTPPDGIGSCIQPEPTITFCSLNDQSSEEGIFASGIFNDDPLFTFSIIFIVDEILANDVVPVCRHICSPGLPVTLPITPSQAVACFEDLFAFAASVCP